MKKIFPFSLAYQPRTIQDDDRIITVSGELEFRSNHEFHANVRDPGYQYIARSWHGIANKAPLIETLRYFDCLTQTTNAQAITILHKVTDAMTSYPAGQIIPIEETLPGTYTGWRYSNLTRQFSFCPTNFLNGINLELRGDATRRIPVTLVISDLYKKKASSVPKFIESDD